MIAFTMSNAVFDIGLRSTSNASTCSGLFSSVTDCLDKFMIAGIVLSYLDSDTQIKAMCPYVSRSATTVTFSNGTVTAVVSDQDAVTVSVSGGGGGDTPGEGLPEYTLADNGKVLTVSPASAEVTVVPEQALVETADAYPTIANHTLTTLSDGDIVTVTINGTDYNTTAVEEDGNISLSGSLGDYTWDIYFDEYGSETYVFAVMDNGNPVPGTYTVSAVAIGESQTEVEPAWKSVPEVKELPTYTASDRGKVLTVVNKYVTSEVISERTVTVSDNAVVLTNTGLGDINLGDIVTLTVNDVEYMSAWIDGDYGQTAYFNGDDDIIYQLAYASDTAYFFPFTEDQDVATVEPGEYTIHATVTTPSTTEANTNWMEPSSGIYMINATEVDDTVVLDKDFAEIVLAISNGLYPWIRRGTTLYTVIGIDTVELELYCLNSGGSKITFEAQSDSDYPVYDPLG